MNACKARGLLALLSFVVAGCASGNRASERTLVVDMRAVEDPSSRYKVLGKWQSQDEAIGAIAAELDACQDCPRQAHTS